MEVSTTPRRKSSKRQSTSGCALLEMALALAVMALLFAPLVHWQSTQRSAKEAQTLNAETQQVDQALQAFVMAHGRLPCPATNGLHPPSSSGAISQRSPRSPRSPRPSALDPGQDLPDSAAALSRTRFQVRL